MSITITDICIVLIFSGFIIYGCKIGLIKAVVDLLAVFLTGILTWFLYPHFAALIMKTPLYYGINKWITLTLNNNDILSKSIPEFLIKLPDFMKDSIAIASKQAFESTIASVSEGITVLAVNAISIILLFILIRLMMLLIKKIGYKINKLFVIGPVNVILGGIFGLIQGVLIVNLAVMIISCFPTSKLYDRVAVDIEKSYISGYMFNEDSNFLGIPVKYPINNINK